MSYSLRRGCEQPKPDHDPSIAIWLADESYIEAHGGKLGANLPEEFIKQLREAEAKSKEDWVKEAAPGRPEKDPAQRCSALTRILSIKKRKRLTKTGISPEWPPHLIEIYEHRT